MIQRKETQVRLAYSLPQKTVKTQHSIFLLLEMSQMHASPVRGGKYWTDDSYSCICYRLALQEEKGRGKREGNKEKQEKEEKNESKSRFSRGGMDTGDYDGSQETRWGNLRVYSDVKYINMFNQIKN